MSADQDSLLSAIATLVETLPEGAITPLADAIARSHPGDWRGIESAAGRVLAAPDYRAHISTFIAAWQRAAPLAVPSAVALALAAAMHTLGRQRRTQTIEPVWTGPGSGRPLRRTAQVLQELIDAAERELLIVSFAVYDIAEIRHALLRAAQRAVPIRLVIESPKERAGTIATDGLRALGAHVAAQAEVYRWPSDKRPRDDAGKPGALHVKCAIADQHLMLISSANLTRYALDLNMELGVLIRGAPLPGQIAAHFQQLIDRQILVRVPTE